MDDKIKPSEVYAPTIINISNENNESFDGKANDIQWGENGATMKLLNIIIATKDVGLEDEVNVQEQEDLQHYVEMTNNPNPTQERSPTKAIYDLGVIIDGPINEV